MKSNSALSLPPIDVRPRHNDSKLVPTVFHERWWLEITGEGAYEEVSVENGGRVVGRLPYRITKRVGQSILKMPILTYALGPAINVDSNDISRVTTEFSIISRLISQLPPAAHIHMRLHRSLKSTMPFQAAGFETGVDFTVTVEPVPEDVLWKKMRDKNRNIIRRAAEKVEVRESFDGDAFASLYENNIIAKSKRNSYSKATLSAIVGETLSRGRGRIITAVDPGGEPHAAIFTAWDRNTEYYLLSTRKHEGINGSVNLLLWECIKRAHACGRSFDMAGLHVVGPNFPNLHLLTGFGGEINPVFFVRRTSAALKLMRIIKQRYWQQLSSA